ncbi:hypothetical protein [Nocardia niwae]|uniref:hypothetical protein n=1 Tax=Nocardia niwae TaxID=626084 RepID=UPI0033C7F050
MKLHAWLLDQNPVPDPKLSVALSVADIAHLPPELACVLPCTYFEAMTEAIWRCGPGARWWD